MATYEEGKGWKSNTGINDYHSTQGGAEARDQRFNASMRSNSGGGGSNIGDSVLNGGMAIFFLLGKIIGKIIGAIFGILFKLGIVGKVIQSAIFGAGAFVLLIIIIGGGTPLSRLVASDGLAGWITFFSFIIPAAALVFWFWQNHYKALKAMPLGDFINLTAICFSICLYGTIISALIFAFFIKIGEWTLGVSLGIPLFIAALVWFFNTREYAGLAKSFDELTKAANSGDSEAQHELGLAYFYGEGVKEDKKKAVELFQKSAEKGVVDAYYQLAAAYFDGEGTKKDLDKSLKWYKKAADSGHPEGEFGLAVIYALGECGVTKDLKKAKEWCNKAAAQGHEEAKEFLKELE